VLQQGSSCVLLLVCCGCCGGVCCWGQQLGVPLLLLQLLLARPCGSNNGWCGINKGLTKNKKGL
jgi:hypothetical protein